MGIVFIVLGLIFIVVSAGGTGGRYYAVAGVAMILLGLVRLSRGRRRG